MESFVEWVMVWTFKTVVYTALVWYVQWNVAQVDRALVGAFHQTVEIVTEGRG